MLDLAGINVLVLYRLFFIYPLNRLLRRCFFLLPSSNAKAMRSVSIIKENRSCVL